MSEEMCRHCGESPAVTLRIPKDNPDLDGNGVGWSETAEILDDEDLGDDSNFYVITGY